MALASALAFFGATFGAGFALGLLVRWDRLDDPPTAYGAISRSGRVNRQLRQWGDELAADLLDEVGDETTGDAA